MTIFLKNKHTLQIDDFYFKCCIGKNGASNKKKEGDKKTPRGTYGIEHLYYRIDRLKKPNTSLKCITINKSMGWCDDLGAPKKYNKIIKIKDNIKYEKLYRHDYKYDLLLPIKYNFKKPVLGKGSCIFIHLTKNYFPTAGCIGIQKKDFLILLKIINKDSKIKIY